MAEIAFYASDIAGHTQLAARSNVIDFRRIFAYAPAMPAAAALDRYLVFGPGLAATTLAIIGGLGLGRQQGTEIQVCAPGCTSAALREPRFFPGRAATNAAIIDGLSRGRVREVTPKFVHPGAQPLPDVA